MESQNKILQGHIVTNHTTLGTQTPNSLSEDGFLKLQSNNNENEIKLKQLELEEKKEDNRHKEEEERQKSASRKTLGTFITVGVICIGLIIYTCFNNDGATATLAIVGSAIGYLCGENKKKD